MGNLRYPRDNDTAVIQPRTAERPPCVSAGGRCSKPGERLGGQGWGRTADLRFSGLIEDHAEQRALQNLTRRLERELVEPIPLAAARLLLGSAQHAGDDGGHDPEGHDNETDDDYGSPPAVTRLLQPSGDLCCLFDLSYRRQCAVRGLREAVPCL